MFYFFVEYSVRTVPADGCQRRASGVGEGDEGVKPTRLK